LTKQRSPSRTVATADYSTMKAFAHLSPTVPAIFVAAMGIALSVFVLHGAWVTGEPRPLLAAVGGAAGRVVADLPATVNHHRASEPVRKLASMPSERFVPRRQQAATNAAPATTVATSRSVSNPTEARGKARGHGHGRALKSAAATPVPRTHGHGKAFGHSSEHHNGLPRGHVKQPPTAPLPAPTTPPKVHGGGNGHKGGKK
jgi:hypothetical protein